MWYLDDLVKITDTQLKNLFDYSNQVAINTYAKSALKRMQECFSHSNNKHFPNMVNWRDTKISLRSVFHLSLVLVKRSLFGRRYAVCRCAVLLE